MEKKKFTIITVCYNAEKYIKETIDSLLCQTCKDYEYIIKDGLSTDKTLEIAYSMLDGRENVHIISSKDEGIYDAMNQAIEVAKGEYVFFLNAGDCFYSKDVLEKTKQFIRENMADVVYGNILSVSNKRKELRTYGKLCSKKLYFLIGSCICHQAMFVKRQLFEDKKFDINYRVCADRELQLYYLNKRACFKPMGFEVAKVLEDGFSKNNIETLERETKKCLREYCKNEAWIYSIILQLKKKEMLLKIVRAVERFIFIKKYDEK